MCGCNFLCFGKSLYRGWELNTSADWCGSPGGRQSLSSDRGYFLSWILFFSSSPMMDFIYYECISWSYLSCALELASGVFVLCIAHPEHT